MTMTDYAIDMHFWFNDNNNKVWGNCIAYSLSIQLLYDRMQFNSIWRWCLNSKHGKIYYIESFIESIFPDCILNIFCTVRQYSIAPRGNQFALTEE